jgi:protoporphyrinogen oxidase
MKIGIIGGGPAGITAAYLLSKRNIQVDLYEAGPQVGGLSKSINLWNQKVDLGPHRFFSNDKRVNDLWREVAGNDFGTVNRTTRIYYNNQFYYYPLRPVNVLSNLGLIEAGRCVASYIKSKIIPVKQDGSFEAWVSSRFGKRLFEKFFKTYTEKLWGIKCSELDADWAGQRIKKLSMFEVIKTILAGNKNNKHKTLLDQFLYPTGGSGMIYDRMAEFISGKGNKILLNTPIKKVLQENSMMAGLELMNGEIKKYDHVISTMPLSLMVSRLPDVPSGIKEAAESLKFRNTILVYLNVDSDDLFKDNWLYIHSKELKAGRVTNFRNWVPELYGNEKTSILALEFWCYEDDSFWSMKEEDLIELAKTEIRKTGLIKNAAILNSHIYKIPRCYPLYSKGYMEKLKPVQEYLKSIKNLSVIGRYGSFKYNNQDHSMLMAILAVENILDRENHDLWEINTDYESYQED